MAKGLLLCVAQLRDAVNAADCVIFDCRFDLLNPAAGLDAYLDAHIPGAVYAHLDHDLAGPVTAGSGRHPLPDPGVFAAFLGQAGWQPGKLLVAYDDAGGAIAARLWWLMKYFGHDRAPLLDGGIAAWQAAGLGLESGNLQACSLPPVKLAPRDGMVLSATEVDEGLSTDEIVLVDARAPERFSGEIEPIDALGGHIPGAVNHPFSLNLAADGRFRPAGEIRTEMDALRAAHQAPDIVHMCGSGVTACLNLFASELAGLKGSRLYAGSWSEWIQDSSRPVDQFKHRAHKES